MAFDFSRIFNPQAQQQPQQPSTNPGDAPTSGGPGTTPQPQQQPVTPNPQNPDTPPQPVDPLAAFENLFETKPQEGEKPPGIDDPYLNIESDAIRKIAGARNFVSDNEEMAGLANELFGEKGGQALQLLNMLAQTMYGHNAELSGVMANKVANIGVNRLKDSVPNMFREFSTNQAVSSANPAFKSKALSPIINMVQKAMLEQDPNASANDIAAGVGEFMQQLSKSLAPQDTNKAKDINSILQQLSNPTFNDGETFF